MLCCFKSYQLKGFLKDNIASVNKTVLSVVRRVVKTYEK